MYTNVPEDYKKAKREKKKKNKSKSKQEPTQPSIIEETTLESIDTSTLEGHNYTEC